jgi:multiple antibiotic resistance protein
MAAYLQSVLTLFAIVDPVGNIPILLDVATHLPGKTRTTAFNTAVLTGMVILLIFSFAGNWILGRIFHISLADLRIAGGILLLLIAIDHLLFGSLRRSIKVRDDWNAHEIGCVPLACPLLAGPGAMVTSINNLEAHGPIPAVAAILTVFAILWLIMRFVEPLHKLLGRLFCTVFSKVMCLFIASIGIHFILTGIQTYFTNN